MSGFSSSGHEKGWAVRVASRLLRPLLGRLQSPARALTNPYLSAKFLPLQGASAHVIVPRAPRRGADTGSDLPVPPRELWEGYGDTEGEYLDSGRQDLEAMLGVLGAAGANPHSLPRVLEFGCAAGRMLRYFPERSEGSETWGIDIKARHIAWCQAHLSPPFRFATTTTSPHIPFEDNYFDLIYCASVFTHISDLADAWLLELRRALRPGGLIFITVHDKHSIDLLLTRYRDRKDYAFLIGMLHRLNESTAVLSQEYLWFAVGTEPSTQVFYDADYLIQKWSAFMTFVSVTPEAYGYQTALLLRKNSPGEFVV